MEMLDYYSEDGEFLGTEDRKIVHRDGLWHKTVHCWLYDKNGDVFFQRRADKKTLYTTASGHVAASETVKEAFGREIFEELGSEIDYEKAEFCGVINFKMDREENDGSVFKDRAFANIYVYEYDQEYDFNYDFDEISEIVKVNALQTLEVFKNESGSVVGEVIRLENNKLEIEKKDILFEEFLVNKGETALTKYGDVLNKIIELTQGGN